MSPRLRCGFRTRSDCEYAGHLRVEDAPRVPGIFGYANLAAAGADDDGARFGCSESVRHVRDDVADGLPARVASSEETSLRIAAAVRAIGTGCCGHVPEV